MSWGAVAGAAIGVVGGMMASDAASDSAEEAARASGAAAKDAAAVEKYIYEQNRRDATPYRQVGNLALNRLAMLSGFAPNDLTQAYKGEVKPEPDALLAVTPASLRLQYQPQFTTSVPEYHPTEGEIMGYKDVVDEAGLQAAIEQEMRRVADLREAQQNVLNASAQQIAPGTTAGRPGASALFTTSPDYQFRLGEGQKAIERSAAARGGLLSGATLKAMQRYGQDLASGEFSNSWNRMASLAGIGQTANQASMAAGSNYANALSNIYTQQGINAGNAALAGGAARSSAYTGAANALSDVWARNRRGNTYTATSDGGWSDGSNTYYGG